MVSRPIIRGGEEKAGEKNPAILPVESFALAQIVFVLEEKEE
jgi:hypothetical protein